MKTVRHWMPMVLLATFLANVCNAQPHPQIATAKSNRAAGAAVVGGAASLPDGRGGKPRFPIIPAGAVVKPANTTSVNQQGAMSNRSALNRPPANATANSGTQQQVAVAGTSVQDKVAPAKGPAGTGSARSRKDKGSQSKKQAEPSPAAAKSAP